MGCTAVFGLPLGYGVSAMQGERAAEYRDGKTLLAVTFEAGAPAPWVRGDDGRARHPSL